MTTPTPIKENFQSFMWSAILLKQIGDVLQSSIMNDGNCKSFGIQFNTNQASIALMAMPAWAAFAVEMGLKTLLVHSSSEIKPEGHNLAQLFGRLPRDIQEIVKNMTMVNLPMLDINDFSKLLRKHKEVFEHWRYFHEDFDGSKGANSEANMSFLFAMLMGVHNTLINMRNNQSS